MFTGGKARAERVSAPLVAGTVWVNCFFVRDLTAPFGGAGLSGIGCGRAGSGQPGAVGGTRAVFDGPDRVADLGRALATIGPQAAAGFTTFCIKPSQFTDDPADLGRLCREIIRRVEGMLP